MTETEPPLTPVERLAIAALYAHLTLSQNRSVPGQFGSESACCSDLNICSPETLSHEEVPVSRSSEGFRTEQTC